MATLDEPLILPRSATLDGIVEETFDAVEAVIAFDRIAFCRVSGSYEVEIIGVRPAGQPPAGVGTRIPFSQALGADAVRAGLAVEVELERSPLPFDRTLLQAGFRYVLRAPIRRDGLAAAALALLRRGEPFSDDDVAALGTIGTSVAPSILRLAHRQ